MKDQDLGRPAVAFSRHRLGALLTLTAVALFLAAIPGGGTPPARPSGAVEDDGVLAADGPSITLQERSYRLEANPLSTVVTVEDPREVEYASFPLLMLPGTRRAPPRSHRAFKLENGDLVATLTSASGAVLERAALDPGPDSFTVQFDAAVPSTPPSRPSVFFCDGVRGLEAGRAGTVFVPDPVGALDPAGPSVMASGRRPFAPPPFQIQFRGPAGWMGLGLVQVPDATSMRPNPGCGIAIDYRLGLMRSVPNLGGGGRFGSTVAFPTFVATFGADPFQGLRAYYTALAGMGAAPPVDATRRPPWWQEPMVDTWGEQRAEGVARGSAGFTAAWVLNFANQWRARFGVSRFTLVIDSRWQRAIGDPTPDPVRFGGWAGMRRLVDELHSEGIRVLVWWPMWIRYPFQSPPGRAELAALPARYYVDPTAPGFEADTRALVSRLLGTANGDLGVDGLKLDWGYDLSPAAVNPALGWGAAALFHYMNVLHTAAHDIRPDALIDSSAVAPQFASTTDSIRLYDGWNEAEWSRRAAIVTAVDPGTLIDGDGWRAGPATIGPHTVASTVYGIPAIYFSERWASGAPLPEGLAATLGRVVALSTLKGAGMASITRQGDWHYYARGALTAESFDSNRALAVWTYTGCGATARVVSTVDGDLRVPLPWGGVRPLDARAGGGYTFSAPIRGCHLGRRTG